MTYFCVDDCSYKITPALALGKTTICWRCGESFKMSEYSLRLVKPHCDSCHKSKSDKSNNTIVFTPINHSPSLPSDNEVQKSMIEDLIERYYDTEAPIDNSLSLSDRLKKTTQINHDKHEDESDEEL